MGATDDILVERDAAGIVVVTLNRPAKRNAISFAMWRGLGDVFTGFADNGDVRVVILTGAEGHFCAGADISEFAKMRNPTPRRQSVYNEAGHRATLAIIDLPQPTIAAAQGYGVGGGCGLALACDLRVGDATTQMGIPAAGGASSTACWIPSLLTARGRAGEGETGAVLGPISSRPADCRAMGLVDVVSRTGCACPAPSLWRATWRSARRCHSAARSWCWRRSPAMRCRSALAEIAAAQARGRRQRGLPGGDAVLPGKAHAGVHGDAEWTPRRSTDRANSATRR